MIKNDLKTGYIVTLRDGTELIVIKNFTRILNEFEITDDIIVNSKKYYWQSLKDYDDELKNKISKDFDIIKVESISHPYCIQEFELYKNERTTIWERYRNQNKLNIRMKKEDIIKRLSEIMNVNIIMED